jgi:hypothetical protein
MTAGAIGVWGGCMMSAAVLQAHLRASEGLHFRSARHTPKTALSPWEPMQPGPIQHQKRAGTARATARAKLIHGRICPTQCSGIKHDIST